MELHIVRVPAEVDTLKVLCLGDLHVGHACHDEGRLDYYLSLVDANTRIVMLGDLYEHKLRHSKGRPSEQVRSVQEQRQYLQRKLMPHRDKIVAGIIGNHEERSLNEGGDDPMAILCEILGVHYMGYSGVVAFCSNKVNACSYTIAMRHGNGGGGMAGAAVNEAHRAIWNVQGVDIYLSGHTHKPNYTPPMIGVCPDLSNRKLIEREQHVIINGALLGWEGSYAEPKNMRRYKSCQAIISLSMMKRNRQIGVAWE